MELLSYVSMPKTGLGKFLAGSDLGWSQMREEGNILGQQSQKVPQPENKSIEAHCLNNHKYKLLDKIPYRPLTSIH